MRSFAELNVFPKPQQCQGCPLATSGASFARGTGSGRNGVALIGEALGETEAIKGIPFQGDAGMMLNRILHRGELKRADFYITNTVKCHPPNNYLDGAPYHVDAVQHCDHYLEDELQNQPHIRVLVPMGNIAMEPILGFRGIKNAHGTIHWSDRWGRWVVPTIHPSAVLRDGGKELPTVLFDFNRAIHLASGKTFNRTTVQYALYPTVEEFGVWIRDYELHCRDNRDTILACDIETPWSGTVDEEEILEKEEGYDIIRIGFSYQPCTAITLPFSREYRPLVMRLLAHDGVKCFWNGNKFDVPRLRSNRMQVNGLIIDGMDAWHVYKPDLPKGLGYVSPFFTDLAPWKHLSGDMPEFYNATDADATIRIIYKLRDAMRREGTWDTFVKYWIALEPRLQAMSSIGIGIDDTIRKQREAEYRDIADNIESKIQPLIPDVVKPRAKGKEHGYKGVPKDVRLFAKANSIGKANIADAWRACGYQLFKYPTENGTGQETVQRWDKILPFNYNSAQQIIDYITHTYGAHEVPLHPKTGNPTTGKEELERLARRKKDEVLYLILDAANADGKITSFIRPWTPQADGRVHGIFTNTPATPRLASQRPNLQNFPRRDEEAQKLRQMIIPGDGWEWLVEADYKSIEAILVGWYAKDLAYMRLGYFGIHDFMVGKKLNLDINPNWSDGDLRLALKEAKKLGNRIKVPGSVMCMRDACKQSVHGGNYLEGARLLHLTYPELFPKIKDAEEYQDFYFDLFPSIPIWQQKTIDDCWETSYVENAWKIRRWLYATKQWKHNDRTGKWELVNGDDAKKAVATNPQGSAGMIIRGAKLSDAAMELIECGSLMLTVHDSLVARARDARHSEWVMEKLNQAMCYTIKEMDNIIIPIEFKVGRNWGQLEEQ